MDTVIAKMYCAIIVYTHKCLYALLNFLSALHLHSSDQRHNVQIHYKNDWVTVQLSDHKYKNNGKLLTKSKLTSTIKLVLHATIAT